MILLSLNFLIISCMRRLLLTFRIVQSELKQNSISIDLLCTHTNLFDISEDLLTENKHVFIKKASLLYIFLHFCKMFFKTACGNSKAGIKKLQSFNASSSGSSKCSIMVYVKRTKIYEAGNNFFSISITCNNSNTTCYCCCIPYIQTFL